MATSLLPFQTKTHPVYPNLAIQSPNNLAPRSNPKFQFPPTILLNTKHKCFFSSDVVALSYVSKRTTPSNGDREENDFELVIVLNKWLQCVHSALPAGSWWNFNEFDEVDSIGSTAKQISVWDLFRRMWGLVVDDKWILFVAFGSLIIAAVLEISIPNLLATSIFLAESGGTSVFFKNAYLLAMLCITSGIFRSKSNLVL